MVTRPYIVVNSRGTVRVGNRGVPSLSGDEIAIRLELNLPNELFTKPRLEATITVPANAVRGSQIEAEVVDNIQEAIQSASGLDVSLTLVRPDDE